MATSEQVKALRQKIGESIPPDGTESDTLFTDAEVGVWVDNYTPHLAAAEGWEAKMAHWANLVNVTDGAASRELSDLMDHAEKMVSYYRRQALGPVRSRTRVGKIVRLT